MLLKLSGIQTIVYIMRRCSFGINYDAKFGSNIKDICPKYHFLQLYIPLQKIGVD